MLAGINKLLTWNIKGFKRNAGLLNDFFKGVDVIWLEETWLREFKDNILHTFFPTYIISHKYGMKSDIFYSDRPFGGVATVWKTYLNSCIENWPIDLYNLLVTKVKTNNGSLFIVNVYFLTNTTDNQDSISEYISHILSLWEQDEVETILVCGDFNPGINTVAYGELKKKCQEHGLHILDHELLPCNSYTYLSDMNSCTSWIDHIVCSPGVKNWITKCEFNYNCVLSDHMPSYISCNRDLECVEQDNDNKAQHCFKLDKSYHGQIKNYSNALDNLYTGIEYTSFCTKVNCDSESHKKLLEECYADFVKSMVKCKENSCKRYNGNNKANKVPGWNNYVKPFHEEYREAYANWVNNGKEKTGPLREQYTKHKKLFKKALKLCRRDFKMH